MLLLNTLLALAWVAVTGQLTVINLFAGFAIGYFVLWLSFRVRAESAYFFKVRQVTRCATHFLWELWTATLRVAFDILSPRAQVRPAVIAIPLEGTDENESEKAPSSAEITTLANLITLTPGTLCLDVSADGRTLFVHTMHADDTREAKFVIQSGLGKQVRSVFR